MNDEQIRKGFEEWMGDGGLSPRAIERNSNGGYILMQAAHAWEVWKAAHTHYAKSAAPVALPPHLDTTRLQHAVWRLEDILKDDDGQAWKEARKFLERLKKQQWQEARPQADALDAERWRFIKRKLCLTGNGDGTCAMQALNLPARILGWPDVGELAIAQFLDAAIDAAIATAKENK